MVIGTYGPSVQVNTWLKPQDLTSLSASLRDLTIVMCFSEFDVHQDMETLTSQVWTLSDVADLARLQGHMSACSLQQAQEDAQSRPFSMMQATSQGFDKQVLAADYHGLTGRSNREAAAKQVGTGLPDDRAAHFNVAGRTSL